MPNSIAIGDAQPRSLFIFVSYESFQFSGFSRLGTVSSRQKIMATFWQKWNCSRMAVEQARKSVAKNLGAKPSEIFFTSGGTESSNTILNAAIIDLECKHIISSPIEHHATLHTVEYLAK